MKNVGASLAAVAGANGHNYDDDKCGLEKADDSRIGGDVGTDFKFKSVVVLGNKRFMVSLLNRCLGSGKARLFY